MLDLQPQTDLIDQNIETQGAPLPPESTLYLDRPPAETQAFQHILRPGSLLRLKAPHKMGKRSFVNRIVAHARQQALATAILDLDAAPAVAFEQFGNFLQWMCLQTSAELGLPPELDEYWDDEIGDKLSGTIYFEHYLLSQLGRPIVLAVTRVDRLFEFPNIANDVLSLLRFWHERAKRNKRFQELRLILAYSTEAYIALDLNQSPFNVGLVLQLPPLALEQAQALAARYGLSWSTPELQTQDLQQIMDLVGSHPYLLQVALSHLAHGELELHQLLAEAPTPSGIYHHYLEHLRDQFCQDAALVAGLSKVMASKTPISLDRNIGTKLLSLGLLQLVDNQYEFTCPLYRQYFAQYPLMAADA